MKRFWEPILRLPAQLSRAPSAGSSSVAAHCPECGGSLARSVDCKANVASCAGGATSGAKSSASGSDGAWHSSQQQQQRGASFGAATSPPTQQQQLVPPRGQLATAARSAWTAQAQSAKTSAKPTSQLAQWFMVGGAVGGIIGAA